VNYQNIELKHKYDDIPTPDKYIISVENLCKELMHIKPHKSPGPDGIPTWILRDFAYTLALPVANIFNCSIRQWCVPLPWKRAFVSPIPKAIPPTTSKRISDLYP